MKNQNMAITAVVALVVAVAAFFGGIQYQKSQQPAVSQTAQGQSRRGTGARPNGNAVRGQIISVDNNGITVKLPDNSSKIVMFSAQTTISKAQDVQKSDIQTGEQVMVFGSTNSDGSISAQSVQLDPRLRMSPTPNTQGNNSQNNY